MAKKHPTALLRVERRSDKKLIVKEITAMDEDGRPVTLKVLSVTPEEPRHMSQDPVAWQEGFDAGRRGLPRKANPYPPGAVPLRGSQGTSRGMPSRCESVDEG